MLTLWKLGDFVHSKQALHQRISGNSYTTKFYQVNKNIHKTMNWSSVNKGSKNAPPDVPSCAKYKDSKTTVTVHKWIHISSMSVSFWSHWSMHLGVLLERWVFTCHQQ